MCVLHHFHAQHNNKDQLTHRCNHHFLVLAVTTQKTWQLAPTHLTPNIEFITGMYIQNNLTPQFKMRYLYNNGYKYTH